MDQAYSVGLGRVELVGGQQVIHGVTPASAVDEPHGGPTSRVDASQRFELRKAAVVRSHHDVTSQHEFYSQGKRHTLHRCNDWLPASAAESHRIDSSVSGPATLLHAVLKLWQIQASSEVVAMTKHHSAPQVIFGIESLESGDQLACHLWRIAVHLGRSVKPHKKNMASDLGGDTALSGIVFSHGASRPLVRNSVWATATASDGSGGGPNCLTLEEKFLDW